jgi:hypothetical protein
MGVRISEVLPAPVPVDVGDGKYFEVQGLPLKALSRLIQTHQEDFAKLLVMKEGKPDYEALMNTAPDLVADIIAAASGWDNDEQERQAAKNLAASVQLIALQAIWKLTVPDVKKLQALLSEVMGSLKNNLPSNVKTVLEKAAAPETLTQTH